jgi:hypothetical protein
LRISQDTIFFDSNCPQAATTLISGTYHGHKNKLASRIAPESPTLREDKNTSSG